MYVINKQHKDGVKLFYFETALLPNNVGFVNLPGAFLYT